MSQIFKYDSEFSEDHIPMLVKESSYEYDQEVLNTPETIADLMRNVFHIHKRTEEFLYLLCQDSAGHVTGVFEVSHGIVNASIMSPREVYMKALLAGAVRIVLVHNHPSQCANPSNADMQVTKSIKQAGQLLNINLADHIIVCENEFFSFAESDLLSEV